MKPPRELIHLGFCGTHGRCRYGALRMEPISRACKELDRLLDFNDEMLLHAKAREFHEEARRPKQRVGVQMGLARAEDMTDPYVKIDAFTDDPEEFIHPGEERPDCPSCVEGKEHYHRKSDGSPVIPPGRGVE